MKISRRPSLSAYDYIIIGSGSAGSTLAARLSEDPGNNVLLIEAGPSDRSLFIQMPAALGIPLMKDRYNWKFFGANEDFHENQSDTGVYTPRGRVLGGSSSINGMNWVRGNRADYDGWCHRGLDDWSYAHCLPYFKRSEHYPQGDTAYRGAGGATEVVKTEIKNPLFQGFLSACSEYGAALNPDHNGAHQGGVHETQRNVSNGVRHSASQAYLHDQPQKDNLELMLETRCNAIKLSQNRAVGVTLYRAGEELNIEVGKELIICAGAIQSPHLLMLSGIGDGDALSSCGIQPRHHLPGVGHNLQDHPAWCFEYGANNPSDSIAAQLHGFGRLKTGLQWLLQKRGLGSSNHFEVGAFLSLISSSDHPDVQLECIAMRGDFAPDGITISPGFQCFASLQRPTSRGKLWIDSADPFKPPKFRFHYLSTIEDKEVALHTVSAIQEIFHQPAWRGRLTSELSGASSLNSKKDTARWLYSKVESNYHPCGTCSMGTSQDAVTNSEGRVHGLDNLRVVDASIIPVIPAGNLNAITIMIAEKIADNILGHAPLKPESPWSEQPAA